MRFVLALVLVTLASCAVNPPPASTTTETTTIATSAPKATPPSCVQALESYRQLSLGLVRIVGLYDKAIRSTDLASLIIARERFHALVSKAKTASDQAKACEA